MTALPLAITGIGAVTPLGHDLATITRRLLAGESVVRTVSSFDVSQHPSQIAAQVDEIPLPTGRDPAAFRRLSRLHQGVLSCATAALEQAGLWERRANLRLGIVLGVGAEWQLGWEEDLARGGQRIAQPEQDAECTLHFTRRELGVTGPTLTVSAACASGNYALYMAQRWLQHGWVDVCLAGACDFTVSPMSMAGFGNLRALSRRNDAPAAASRPFDKSRDGFVIGEGGVVFVLESLAAARRRSAPIAAELAAVGAHSDAFHMVIPSSDPEPAATAMRQACRAAGLDPRDLAYVNAHATSTPVGDVAEAKVLGLVLGDAVGRIPVSSTKSMTGHLVTAAAAFEALACLIALKEQAVPPTINLDEIDPDCAHLCHVPH
ncbi:MAG TPA: beta-ketoacyl-[acyl-carrier-protein] synthase family protein, partial [Gemmatales bacterium]|nr:beta-ketoacyl-[acyl-carrier-protein] synthase family protein [Gemmatales bacterium]